MRIEQQFPDRKNATVGMVLRQARSRGTARSQTLLLIEQIASLCKRLIGALARARQLKLQLMATCRTDRAEKSVMTLAARVIASPHLLRQLPDPWPCRSVLRQQAVEAINNAAAL